VALIEQYAQVRKSNINNAMNELCSYVGSINADLAKICGLAVLFLAPTIQGDWDAKVAPEVTCNNKFKFCSNFANCRLFPKWPLDKPQLHEEQPTSPAFEVEDLVPHKEDDFDTLLAKFLKQNTQKKDGQAQFRVEQTLTPELAAISATVFSTNHPLAEMIENFVELFAQRIGLAPTTFALNTPPPKSLRELRAATARSASRLVERLRRAGFDINTFEMPRLEDNLEAEEIQALATPQLKGDVTKHYPAVDNDDDHFSTENTLRGADWRGKDCDDKNAFVYPGRRDRHSSTSDPNVDHNCNGIKGVDENGVDYEKKFCGDLNYGVIAIGDSATAHFSIPPQWLTPSKINKDTFSNLIQTILNEADWPQCSSTTGHPSTTGCPNSSVQFTSLYDYVRARNLCSHRDYQNIGVNGASSRNVYPGVITTLARNQTSDNPALVFYALIGNDVCGKDPSPSAMTSVEEFTANTKQALAYLDTVLPPNSQVFLSGLVDGRILFEAMQNKTHPIGATYPQLYDFLNCLETSPCAGWMNTNAAIRDATTQRAADLSNVYPQLVKNTYKNFKAYYIPLMDLMNEVVQEWTAQGGDKADLIELTDGFHPSTTAQRLLASKIWSFITNKLNVFVPINPHNNDIKQIFGDQGGY